MLDGKVGETNFWYRRNNPNTNQRRKVRQLNGKSRKRGSLGYSFSIIQFSAFSLEQTCPYQYRIDSSHDLVKFGFANGHARDENQIPTGGYLRQQPIDGRPQLTFGSIANDCSANCLSG